MKQTIFQEAINELNRSYHLLNREFFEGELPEVAITVQSKGKRNAMGWCTVKEVWKDNTGYVSMHEINISAEYFNVPFLETMNTLLHEMVHLYNLTRQEPVQDVSRNGTFHNKKFKAESERRGFYYDAPADKKYGWTFSKLTPNAIERILSLGIDQSLFTIARIEDQEAKKKPNSYKWVCPTCELTIRTTKKEHKKPFSQEDKKSIKLICFSCTTNRLQAPLMTLVEDDDNEE